MSSRRKKFGAHQVLIPEHLYYKQAELFEKISKLPSIPENQRLQEPKQEIKQEIKPEPKQEIKQEPKQEIKQEPKQEIKQEPKQEIKPESIKKTTQENDDDFEIICKH